ncbi:MAG: DNA/RNA nuclease SfsA, partial [Beijerinckiaceae bacterium]
ASEGARVYLHKSDKANRKLPHGWMLVEADFGWKGPQLVGIDTSLPNRLVAEALEAGAVPELAGYTSVRREVRYGERSRVDFVLGAMDRPDCYLEVKNVHLMRKPGVAEFPDSVTARGARHLADLAAMAQAGMRAIMLFVIQMDADCFTLAHDIDPSYARAFALARRQGVEALAHVCTVTEREIRIAQAVPILADLTQAATDATSDP